MELIIVTGLSTVLVASGAYLLRTDEQEPQGSDVIGIRLQPFPSEPLHGQVDGNDDGESSADSAASSPATTSSTALASVSSTPMTVFAGAYLCLGQDDGTCVGPDGEVLCKIVLDGHCRDENELVLCGMSRQSEPECIPGLDPGPKNGPAEESP